MHWPSFLASIVVPGAGFLARRDGVAFALVFVTVGLSYASYAALQDDFRALILVPSAYHFLPVLGATLHVAAALRTARRTSRRPS